MTIDYEKKEMTLVPSGYVPGDAMQGLQDKLMKSAMSAKHATPTKIPICPQSILVLYGIVEVGCIGPNSRKTV